MKDEYIIASAVKIDDQVFIGKRHGDAGTQHRALTGVDKTSFNDDGFITSKLRFIDRKEAYKLAKKNGQFNRKDTGDHYKGKELFSEDLW